MEKYNDEIMKAIRQRMGLNENDTSSDKEISMMYSDSIACGMD